MAVARSQTKRAIWVSSRVELIKDTSNSIFTKNPIRRVFQNPVTYVQHKLEFSTRGILVFTFTICVPYRFQWRSHTFAVLVPLCVRKKGVAAILEIFANLYHSHMYKYAFVRWQCVVTVDYMYLAICFFQLLVFALRGIPHEKFLCRMNKN